MSRLARITVPIALAVVLAAPTLANQANSGASNVKTPTVKILACTGATVSRPRDFVISCADANAALTQTHWSTWSANGAMGTTRLALNLCQPSCVASRMSYFPHSSVTLSAPVTTKHGRLFSKLLVRYAYRGKAASFSFSWVGDPSF